jgi:hypothetical protein
MVSDYWREKERRREAIRTTPVFLLSNFSKAAAGSRVRAKRRGAVIGGAPFPSVRFPLPVVVVAILPK